MTRREFIFERIVKNCDIDPDSACWNWRGAHSGSGRGGGYPRMALSGQTVAVHRVMFTCVHGYIPSKKQIDHKCRNRACCNPEHLEMVTHLQNQKRKKTHAISSSPPASSAIPESRDRTNHPVGQPLPRDGEIGIHDEQGSIDEVWSGDCSS